MHHYYHHFHAPSLNHGVTTPFWDVLFGTYAEVETVNVPQRHAVPWMLDQESGAIRREFAADYILRGVKEPPIARNTLVMASST